MPYDITVLFEVTSGLSGMYMQVTLEQVTLSFNVSSSNVEDLCSNTRFQCPNLRFQTW